MLPPFAAACLRLQDGRLMAIGPVDEQTPVLDRRTTASLVVRRDAVPDRLFGLAPGLGLLTTRAGGARREAWLLPAGAAPEELARAAANPDAPIALPARATLGARLRACAAASITDPAGWEGLGDLGAIDEGLMTDLALLADPAAGAKVVAAEAAPGGILPASLAANPTVALRRWGQILKRGRIALPSLFGAGEAEVTHAIPLMLRNQAMMLAWLCRDAGRACLRLGGTDHRRGRGRFGLAWLPDENLLVSGRPLGADALLNARGMLARACAVLAGLPAEARRRLPDQPAGLALFVPACAMAGPHIGHAIWDELSPLDGALSELPRGMAPPPVFRATPAGGSGLDLFGPAEELYPELAGRLTAVETPVALLAGALAAGRQIFPLESRSARQASRRRIGAAAAALAARSGLAAEAEALIAGRPVVAIGLRLTNRRPEDLGGFCRRLTAALAGRLGPCVIVLDGLNAAEDGRGTAATIYSAGSAPGQRLSDGALEMEREAAFAAGFAGFAATLPGPVTVVSCIGMGLRANLHWLSRAGFFVAPLGAGLAKLRWALDVPGLVLTSRANLTLCTLADIYGSPGSMEPPFSPLHYTTVEEVEDLLPEPPRRPPSRPHGVPWPENFRFTDEPALIARICDLAEAALRPPG